MDFVNRYSGFVALCIWKRHVNGNFAVNVTVGSSGERVEVVAPKIAESLIGKISKEKEAEAYDTIATMALAKSRHRSDAERSGDGYKIVRKNPVSRKQQKAIRGLSDALRRASGRRR